MRLVEQIEVFFPSADQASQTPLEAVSVFRVTQIVVPKQKLPVLHRDLEFETEPEPVFDMLEPSHEFRLRGE